MKRLTQHATERAKALDDVLNDTPPSIITERVAAHFAARYGTIDGTHLANQIVNKIPHRSERPYERIYDGDAISSASFWTWVSFLGMLCVAAAGLALTLWAVSNAFGLIEKADAFRELLIWRP